MLGRWVTKLMIWRAVKPENKSTIIGDTEGLLIISYNRWPSACIITRNAKDPRRRFRRCGGVLLSSFNTADGAALQSRLSPDQSIHATRLFWTAEGANR
jgi:hypothetical protein